jgi:DNA-directed RNA polymerase subunit M/transcription elongation factor TFIIS
MEFCENCGVLLVSSAGTDTCEQCDPENGASILSRQIEGIETDLEELHSTKSGHIRKQDSMKWLRNRERPNPTELKRSILPKPDGFSGSSFETDISNIRMTGDAQFIETIAGLLKPLLDLENDETRIEINLQRTKVRDTKQYTGNYALYLSVAERGGEGTHGEL